MAGERGTRWSQPRDTGFPHPRFRSNSMADIKPHRQSVRTGGEERCQREHLHPTRDTHSQGI
jgi:hypothetical protein